MKEELHAPAPSWFGKALFGGYICSLGVIFLGIYLLSGNISFAIIGSLVLSVPIYCISSIIMVGLTSCCSVLKTIKCENDEIKRLYEIEKEQNIKFAEVASNYLSNLKTQEKKDNNVDENTPLLAVHNNNETKEVVIEFERDNYLSEILKSVKLQKENPDKGKMILEKLKQKLPADPQTKSI
ncbi:MAG: hypothetical protein ACK4OM_05655 [Alphaproteobacteria bacterium]